MAKRLHAFRIIVGMGYDREGTPIGDPNPKRAEMLEYCANEFGGATVAQSLGIWKTGKDTPAVMEGVYDLTILRPIDPDDAMESAYRIAIAQDIGRIWDQHSVVIIGPDGRASLIRC